MIILGGGQKGKRRQKVIIFTVFIGREGFRNKNFGGQVETNRGRLADVVGLANCLYKIAEFSNRFGGEEIMDIIIKISCGG